MIHKGPLYFKQWHFLNHQNKGLTHLQRCTIDDTENTFLGDLIIINFVGCKNDIYSYV